MNPIGDVMARKNRISIKNAFYHVTLRGNNKQDIFFDNTDRISFLSLIEEGIIHFGHKIHAFCLMTNHVHLLVETAEISLSKIIQNIAFRYAKRINKKFTRTGHLFHGRFYASHISDEKYILAVLRYIHMNPIKAGMVTKLYDYRWCSHRAYLKIDKINWLTTNKLLSLLLDNTTNYIEFMEKSNDIGMEIDENAVNDINKRLLKNIKNYNKNETLGKTGIVDTIANQTDPCLLLQQKEKSKSQFHIYADKIIEAVCEVVKIDKETLQLPNKQKKYIYSRGIITIFTQKLGKNNLPALSRLLRHDATTLTRSANKIKQQLKHDPTLAQHLRIISEKLQKIAELQH
jgi:putative transposase